MLLDETGLPTRYYLPRADVRDELLVESDERDVVSVQGRKRATGRSRSTAAVHADLVWSYEAPIPDAAGITDLMCFYNERVDINVDGEALVRPETPYSTA